MTNAVIAFGADSIGIVTGMGTGIDVVNHRNSGAANVPLDLPPGHRKGISGDLILIGTILHNIGGHIDRTAVAFTIDQNHTGIAPLHISNAILVGHIFALADEGIVELINGSNLGIDHPVTDATPSFWG